MNTISQNLAQQLNAIQYDISPYKITTGNGIIEVTTQAILNIQIDSLFTKIHAVIISSLEDELILRNEFLSKLKSVLDMQNNTLKLEYSTRTQEEIEKLLANYMQKSNTFKDHPAKGIIHCIQISPGIAPVYKRNYHMNEYKREITITLTRKWLDSNLIEPSVSSWNFPIVLAPKANNEHRLCIDFRELNAVTIQEKTPPPTLEEALDPLGNAKIFTNIDLK
ncbi:hypothetical protein ENBRE01_2863 [Enteropsectra breve]|nr:hypothetical protein ENBRE01_2863 [Enteropsectra breve]